MSIEIRQLASGDDTVLARVAPEVFDRPVNPGWTAEFLNDPRHHLVVALDAGVVVGFVSAVDYIHPDKPAQLFINEVGVAPTHQARGIGRRLLIAMLDLGREIGCEEAWVATERDNLPAMRLYGSVDHDEPEDVVMFTFPLETE